MISISIDIYLRRFRTTEELPFDEALFYTPEEYLLREQAALNPQEYQL